MITNEKSNSQPLHSAHPFHCTYVMYVVCFDCYFLMYYFTCILICYSALGQSAIKLTDWSIDWLISARYELAADVGPSTCRLSHGRISKTKQDRLSPSRESMAAGQLFIAVVIFLFESIPFLK